MAKEELELGMRDPRKTRLIVLGVVVLFLLVIAAGFLPAWRAIKEFRAGQFSKEARMYLEEDNFDQAWERAQTAYQLYPLDAEVARTAAMVYSRIDPSQAVAFWKETYALSGERSDLVELIDVAILARELEIAEESIVELKALGPPLGRALYDEARLLLLQSRVAEAIAAARQSLVEGGAPEDAPFLFVQLTQFSDDPEERAEGVEYLRELARKPNAIGIKALRKIGAFPENTPDELREVINALNEHPARERSDMLYALQLEMRLPDANVADNLSRAKELFDVSDKADLAKFGSWLNVQRRYKQTLDVISEEDALSRRDLFLARADALSALNQWDAVNALLAHSDLPIERFLKHLFQARYYLQTGQGDRANFAWSRAILQAGDDTQKTNDKLDNLWYLEYYATRLGLYDQARETLERLTQLASARRKAYEKLVQLEQRQGTVSTLRDTLKQMSEAYPRDLPVKNDLAYANLLLNENIEESAAIAEELVNDGSPYLANRITLALAYYRMGDNVRAAETLDTLGINWNEARAGFRAVYAAILRSNGRTADANLLLASLDSSELLKEERDLLGQTRG